MIQNMNLKDKVKSNKKKEFEKVKNKLKKEN